MKRVVFRGVFLMAAFAAAIAFTATGNSYDVFIMVVLVVSLSIETVVLTFRLSQDKPEHLPYAASIGVTAALLLAAWGVFIWFNRAAEQLEPEAMQDAKREDRKIDANKGDQKR